ncbi:hypothetical protein BC826DRAFT_1090691 [Russula brevipes]|nr:hypothetical protein BC826DRAFT_1090691 [Russula brevipes]
MALAPPFPPSGRFVEYVRVSSRALTQTEAVTISDTNIERLLHSPAFTETYHRIAATSHGLAFPLKFSSPLSELNLLSILALLNMHLAIVGAWDSIRAFVYGLYLSSATDSEGDLLGARGMQTLSETKIAELLGVSLHIERQHESIQGLTIGQVGGPGWELVQLLKGLLDETGKILSNGGYPDLGSFVAEALKEGARVAHEKDDSAAAADVVLERLVRAFPGFRDMSVVNDQPIYCFKKALFLINAIAIRFGAKDPSPFPVPQTSHLPVFADNVLPSILIHLGIIDLSTAAPALASLFPRTESGAGSGVGGPTPPLDAGVDGAGAAAAADRADHAPPSIASLLAAAAPEPGPAPPGRTTKTIPIDGPVLTPAQSDILRAAAIEACERIVAHAHALATGPGEAATATATAAAAEAGRVRGARVGAGAGAQAGAGAEAGSPPWLWLRDVTPPDLDNWLWAVAKDRADYRALPRFVLRNTPFF